MNLPPIEMRDHDPRHTRPGIAAAPPAQGEAWLRQWAIVGGTISIGVDNSLTPIRIVRLDLDEETAAIADQLERDLLRELDQTPGLVAAVRAVVGAQTSKLLSGLVSKMTGRNPE